MWTGSIGRNRFRPTRSSVGAFILLVSGQPEDDCVEDLNARALWWLDLQMSPALRPVTGGTLIEDLSAASLVDGAQYQVYASRGQISSGAAAGETVRWIMADT